MEIRDIFNNAILSSSTGDKKRFWKIFGFMIFIARKFVIFCCRGNKTTFLYVSFIGCRQRSRQPYRWVHDDGFWHPSHLPRVCCGLHNHRDLLFPLQPFLPPQETSGSNRILFFASQAHGASPPFWITSMNFRFFLLLFLKKRN
jgi:hypothetical protein